MRVSTQDYNVNERQRTVGCQGYLITYKKFSDGISQLALPSPSLHDYYNHIAMQPEFSACSCGNVYVLSRAASREKYGELL
jgi:hypothetical protein